MRLDDSFRDREAEPHASVIVFARLPEVVEKMRDVVGWNSGTGIINLDHHVISVT